MKMILLSLCFFTVVNLSAWGEYGCDSDIGKDDDKYSHESFTSLDNFSNDSFFLDDFSYSCFSGVKFIDSDAICCDFFYAEFEKDGNGNRTLFDGSNLKNSQFKFANCPGASFKGAKLIKCWLWYADLRGTDLTGADLTDSIMFHSKTCFEGENPTIVIGTDCSGVRGLTNAQKKQFRENGALNVPDDCDEQEERKKFKAEMDRICEELHIFYPLNKWLNSCGRGVKNSICWLWNKLLFN